MPKATLKDITGQRFGRLVVVHRSSNTRGGHVKWLARCDCGQEVFVNGSSLRRGITKSCGCLVKDMRDAMKITAPAGETRQDKRARIESKEYLSAAFNYDESTGELTWKTLFPGKPAGTLVKPRGMAGPFIKVAFEKLDFKAHRLIWIMMTGKRPPSFMHIDHIDGDQANNRWNNLRLCEPKQNARNSKKPKNNSSGFKGVARSRAKFRAYICVDRKQINLGTFDTPEEAYRAYCEAALEKFGEYACINR